jgi:hypothetical protein
LETDLNNMTMRDLFAAFALAGLLCERGLPLSVAAAENAYIYADAMIKQRNKDATEL